jgi:electron transfer flavoprotein alpha subunit
MFERPVAEPVAALVVPLMERYDTVLAAATTSGKNFMPRIAALLDVMQISEIVEVKAPDTFVRLIYAGNAIQDGAVERPKKVITVRTAGFQAAENGGSADHRKPSSRRPIRGFRPTRARI